MRVIYEGYLSLEFSLQDLESDMEYGTYVPLRYWPKQLQDRLINQEKDGVPIIHCLEGQKNE